MKCVYCNQEIKKISKEHIIQNALGGSLESKKICCDKCNEFLGKRIDKPFTDMFIPILMHIDNLDKTNKKDSKHSIHAKGITVNSGKYDVIVKDRKITSCPELQKKLKNNYDKSIFMAYNFELFRISDNNSFLNGIKKIAFNYAVHYFNEKKLPTDILTSKIHVYKLVELKEIQFNQEIIPYYPLTIFDDFIENQETEVYHNLILFTFDNKLWCYVGLFNTFKYYVCLSDNCSFSINCSYSQYIKKLSHNTSFINYRRFKHKLILAQEFDVDIRLEDSEFKKQICTKIQKQNKEFDYYTYVNDLCTNTGFLYECIKKDEKFLPSFRNWFNYFTDRIDYENNDYYGEENPSERYINKKYKETILLSDGQEMAYPEYLFNNFNEDQCKAYCAKQLEKLANYIKKNKEERDE